MGTIEHTPGPWQAKAQAIGGYIIAREGVSVVGHSIAGVKQSMAANEAQCEANAHLISAAPEAIEIIAGIAERLPNMPDPEAVPEDICAEIEITWREWSLIRAALQKATPQEIL